MFCSIGFNNTCFLSSFEWRHWLDIWSIRFLRIPRISDVGANPPAWSSRRSRRKKFPRTSITLKLTGTSEKLTATLWTQHDVPLRWKRLTKWRFIDFATTTSHCRQQARYSECTRISCWHRRALLSIPVRCGRILINPGPFEQIQRQRFNDTRLVRVKSLPLIGISASLNKSFCIKKCFFGRD